MMIDPETRPEAYHVSSQVDPLNRHTHTHTQTDKHSAEMTLHDRIRQTTELSTVFSHAKKDYG